MWESRRLKDTREKVRKNCIKKLGGKLKDIFFSSNDVLLET